MIIYLFKLVIPLYIWLQVINKVKVTHQCQGQIKVISKERYSYTGGLHLNQMRSCFKCCELN